MFYESFILVSIVVKASCLLKKEIARINIKLLHV